MTKSPIKIWQTRIFSACFLAYTAAYICRVNISMALPGIQQDMELSSTTIGLIGTAFFWVYALGQLINGSIGNRVKSRTFIFCGLIVSAFINVAIGFSSRFVGILLLWGMNGIFQSMLWGPIVKTLSNWFPARKQDSVAFGISISLIIGYLVAWGLSGYLAESLGWRWVFWIPAAIVFVLAFIWLYMARNKPEDVGLTLVDEDSCEEKKIHTDDIEECESQKISIWKLLKGTSLVLIALTGLAQGAIDKSIQLWMPTLLSKTKNFSALSAVGIMMMFPLINFVGIMFAGWLNKAMKSRTQLVVVLLMAGSAIASLGFVLLFQVNILISILLMAITDAFINGANPLMTTVIPLKYKYCNHVSAVAGFMDFSMYFGAGLGGVFTGWLLDRFGWNTVFAVWCAILVAGTATMGISMIKRKNKAKKFNANILL